MEVLERTVGLGLVWSLLLAAARGGFSDANPTGQSGGQDTSGSVEQTPEELQQLVAPIALYPDALVSQILPAATYPTEIVEADRWVQEHSNLKGNDLANEVDKQPWDS